MTGQPAVDGRGSDTGRRRRPEERGAPVQQTIVSLVEYWQCVAVPAGSDLLIRKYEVGDE